MYYVVQTRDSVEAVVFTSMTSKEYSDKLLELKKEFLAQYKDWRAARSAARRNGEEFAEKSPPKPLLKRIKKIRGKEKADEYAQRLQKKWDAIQKIREAKAQARAG